MATPEHQLFDQLAGPAWAGAEPIQASAPAAEVSASRYRVKGLSEFGETEKAPDDVSAGHYTAVRGEWPD